MANPNSPWRNCSASKPAMEHSTAATPLSLDRHNKYTIPRSRRISNNEIPLVHCPHCKFRILNICTLKTDKNYDRQFYVCPTRTRDGGGCPFWEWEEGYEQYLVDEKLVPLDYQPVLESTKLRPIVLDKTNFKELREIAMLLKYLILVCGLVLASNVYAIVRSG
ncbi:hypothetical protein BRADI_4g45247v3 [Brachypodium distachyon]|uniref:GRF-type domain-containing protein n=1 Tax=Brachypodium distachyon TaxID=15368 RepID=A0A0Q3EZ74_BRADI|nr:hypothetical protein BRADI_4g45247v3 [Brachypodium distachyon]